MSDASPDLGRSSQVQLINKKSDADGAVFEEADCRVVHAKHAQLTDTLNSVPIHKLLS